jgi:hypothetical protein
MRELFLDFATAVGLLCGLVLAVDAAPRAVASLRRRRAARGGAFGVVVDRRGRVLGTYLDPFGHPWRTPREHGPESPWAVEGPDGQAMAWEGFGATREEALHAANRLRRRQLHLLSWLEDDERGEDDWVRLSQPMVPPGG